MSVPHRAVAGGQQHADGLPVATPARLGQVVAADRLAGRSNSVQVIALGAVAARRAGWTVDLGHPFTLLEQVGGEAGPVAAGALDRPDPTSWRLLDGEPVAVQVANGVGGDSPVRDDRTSRADHSDGMAVFVGVDADDVVDLICQHAWCCLLRGVAVVGAGPGEGDRVAGL